MRVRLAWAFAGMALAVMVLTLTGVNVGMAVTMHRMGMGHMWGMGHGMGMGWGARRPVTPAPEATGAVDMAGGLIRWSLWSGAAGLVLAAGAGVWAAERITRPLGRLRDAARQLGLRDLSLRVPVEGDTEVAELAAAFNRMAERLEAEDRARRQLLADVAHELGHPLSVLRGRLELMQDGIQAPTPEALVTLQDEVVRMSRLIGDLRDLSLADAGALSLRLRPVRLEEVVDPLLANLEPVAAGRRIALERDVAPGLPVLEVDPDRIRQVLVNLLSNALRYTPEGGRVTLRAWQHGSEVRIEVADTGPGIDPADLPHVFERFYRADPARTRSAGGGTGLGLAIARSLVHLHGGRIWAENRPEGGSRFTVALPLPHA